MKTKNVAVSVGFTLLALLLGNYAVNKFAKQQHLKQLLATKECLGCDLSHLDLKSTNLQGVNLSGANLARSDLSGANLTGANLSEANLYRTNLSNTLLADANFRNANLEMANLSAADLGCARLNLQLSADRERANLKLNLDRGKIHSSKSGNLELNFNLDSSSISFNLFDCPDFSGANLNKTILPDGSKY